MTDTPGDNNNNKESRVSPEDQDFLQLLRAHDGNFQEPKMGDYEEQNADTLRAGNHSPKLKTATDLSSLFDPPSVPKTSTSSKTDDRSKLSIPPLPPLAESSETNASVKATLRTIRRPAPISGRNRSVSFDRQVQLKSFEASPNQSILEESTELKTIGQDSDSLEMNSHQRIPSIDIRPRTFSVDDLLSSGPYELEAETNILKAIEEHQQEKPGHHRFRSETSSILTPVPDTIVHDFSLDEDKADSTIESGTDNSGSFRKSKDNQNEDDTIGQQMRPLLRNKESQNGRGKSIGERLVGMSRAMQSLDELTQTRQVKGPSLSPNFNLSPVDDTAGEIELQDSWVGSWVGNRERLPSLQEELESTAADPAASKIDVESQLQDEDVEKSTYVGDLGDKNDGHQKRLGRDSVRWQLAKDKVQESEILQSFFYSQSKQNIRYYCQNVGILLILLISAGAITFYAVERPSDSEDGASVSWYLIFCARQLVTLSLALASQIFIIDFLCVSTKNVLRLFGQFVTLLLVMSKGWPFVVFMWSIYDFAMLYGDHPFAKHWLYWQNTIDLFNEANPGGNVVNSPWNRDILLIGLCVSFLVSLKRFTFGLYLGRKTVNHYGEKLAKVMGKMLIISEVANLAKRISRASITPTKGILQAPDNFGQSVEMLQRQESEEDGSSVGSTLKSTATEKAIDMDKRDPLTGGLELSEKIKLIQLLGRWEEPDRMHTGSSQRNNVSIAEVLRFRNALTFINDDYLFSYAFGLASSRERAIQSSQEVYSRLLSKTPHLANVQFETIAYIALQYDGTIDQQKAKEAMKVFRPDRDGNLTLLDFIKSTDSVYKEFRLLQASIRNSSKIDRAFESIFNFAFYGVIVTIILSILGVDPLSLFLSLSSIIFAFAFMIGSASSKYFEGLLFILVRRPYGIGDIIHISNVEQETSVDGSQGWIVQNVSLFETTATWVPTLERASFSNGSLASSRIINWARSPNARFNIFLSFPIATKYETVEIFKRAVEEYLKVRPREWLALNGFRVKRIHTEKASMEVQILLQHRDSWQNIGQISDSKANLISYCHEVQKKLGMQYHSPPVPLQVLNENALGLFNASTSLDNSLKEPTDSSDETIDDVQFQQFRTMAMKKYNIRVA